ncbi:uncharacterized protein LOC114252542 [Bombyx mandarina]|uniref:Uncharacterized protein LOC114252542 n=1 Tax=Bombyx mandarina TaxID=7092 RepID=A0A6J2KMT6_BOMMA|nr:uncharacterized protein LOC114252542 [Bombyx mandarina]
MGDDSEAAVDGRIRQIIPRCKHEAHVTPAQTEQVTAQVQETTSRSPVAHIRLSRRRFATVVTAQERPRRKRNLNLHRNARAIAKSRAESMRVLAAASETLAEAVKIQAEAAIIQAEAAKAQTEASLQFAQISNKIEDILTLLLNKNNN